jgi:large subunit ribosomal protein L22
MSKTKKQNTTEEKIAKVVVRDIAQSPYKLRLVADAIRGLSAQEALDTMEFLNRKGTTTVKKALLSAIDSAINKYGVTKEELVVNHVSVDGARVLKKAIYATKGRFSLGHKRRSHLNLELRVK